MSVKEGPWTLPTPLAFCSPPLLLMFTPYDTPAALSPLVCTAKHIAVSDRRIFLVIPQLLWIREGFLEEASPGISLEG